MKRLSIIFILLTSGLFGQDNPMFDSLDYFQRNKIKTIHCKTESWWYRGPFKEWSISFDKDAKTKKYHSFVYWDSDTSGLVKAISSNVSNPQNFNFDDYSGHSPNGESFTEIKHIFDNKKRLQKKIMVQKNSNSVSTYGFRFSGSTSSTDEVNKEFITSTNYYYSDTASNKLKRIVEESPYHIEETNFYYEKFLLTLKTITDSNKIDNKIKFETISYDYYPDRKLKRQTRRVASDHCPGIYGRTECYGSTEFKYDTEFLNDSTSIPGIPYVYLLTIENKLKNEVHVELTGHNSKTKTSEKIMDIFPRLRPDSIYELVFDPRPDHNNIYPAKKSFYAPFDRKKFTDIEINVYVAQSRDHVFDHANAETLYNEKYTVESLFKKKKVIKIVKK